MSVWVPLARPLEYVCAYKASRRTEDDLCLTSAGVRVSLEARGAAGWAVADAAVVMGGMAPVTRFAVRAGAALTGAPWDVAVLADAGAAALAADFASLRGAGVPGGVPEYRVAAAAGLLLRALVDIDAALRADLCAPPRRGEAGPGDCSAVSASGGGVAAAPPPPLSAGLASAGTAAAPPRGVSVGVQEFDVPVAESLVAAADHATEAGRALAGARPPPGSGDAAVAACLAPGNDGADGAVALGAALRHASGDLYVRAAAAAAARSRQL